MKQHLPAPRSGERYLHKSLGRGLKILETVAAAPGLTSLSEVARRTDLHRSTAHHLLQTLVGLDYLHQDPKTRGYELTAKLVQLAGHTWTPEQLGAVGASFAEALTETTGEGSSIAAYRDGELRIVCKHDPKDPVRVVQDIGALRPIHATAVGKAILAFLPKAERASLLARLSLERFTPKTIVTREDLKAELKRIRANGCATDDEEHIEGIRCIAAPVFAYSGKAVASICAIGPRSRMTLQRLHDLRAPMLAQAQALSARLGWTGAVPHRQGAA